MLSGSATTSASGQFSLQSEGTTEAAVLMAEGTGDFASSVLVEAGGAARGTVQTAPMTAETDTEADVFIAARQRGSRARVADAVLFVTADVTTDVRAGQTTTAQVAAALDSAAGSSSSSTSIVRSCWRRLHGSPRGCLAAAAALPLAARAPWAA